MLLKSTLARSPECERTDADRIPVCGTHRGIGLHNHQTPARLEIVRAAINRVADMGDITALAALAANPREPPESRLFAGHKIAIEYEMAAERRENRPSVDLDKIAASIAGLDSRNWRDPDRFASLFDHDGIEREQPLDDG